MNTATAAAVQAGARVRVRLPQWLMLEKDLMSREMEGQVLRTTRSAILFRGSAVVRASQSCLRCGKKIMRNESRWCGYGPECAEKLGIDWRTPTPEEQEELRRRVAQRTEVEVWLPLSQVQVEVLEQEPATTAETPSQPGAQFRSAAAQQQTANRVTVQNGRILARCEFRFKDALKALPGARWDKEQRAWTYPVSPAAMERLVQALGLGDQLAMDDAARQLLEQAQAIREAAEFKRADDLPQPGHTKFQLWRHQLQAFHFAKAMPACGLFMEMGCGKSLVAVALRAEWQAQLTLIICPKSVVQNVWPGEFTKHAQEPVRVIPLSRGTVAQKQKEAAAAVAQARATGQPVVLVIGYQSAWREPFASWALQQEWDMVVLDESHKIKAPGGKVSMFCAQLGRRAKRRLVLTGTPAPHSPLDVYAQYRFLDPGVFGTSFNAFKQRYAVMGGYGGYQVLGFRHLEELNQKMYSIAFRVRSTDVLDLPPIQHLTRTCKLSAEGARVYRQLAEEMIAEIQASEITATNALTKLLRLQQITSGFVRTDDGRDVQVDTSKQELFADVLEDIVPAEPVVVFARFQHDLDVIRQASEKAGRRYFELSGRMDQVQAWKQAARQAGDGPAPVIGVQIQAGGAGIDLTEARYVIYYSKGFSLGDYEQSLARAHRPGQTRHTYVIHLVAEGTVDVKVERALSARRDVVEAVLQELTTSGEEPVEAEEEE